MHYLNPTTRRKLQRHGELSPDAIQHQAEQLADFVSRGGSASRWLDTKGFLPGDRRAILLAYADAEAA